MTTVEATCPECEVAVEKPQAVRLGEIVECAGCAAELEVIGVAPHAYAVAPDVEEDWGE